MKFVGAIVIGLSVWAGVAAYMRMFGGGTSNGTASFKTGGSGGMSTV